MVQTNTSETFTKILAMRSFLARRKLGGKLANVAKIHGLENLRKFYSDLFSSQEFKSENEKQSFLTEKKTQQVSFFIEILSFENGSCHEFLFCQKITKFKFP